MANKQCNFCNSTFDKFLPLKDESKYFQKNNHLVDIIDTKINELVCPLCGSHAQQRHLKLFFEKLNLLSNLKEARILHFAPESHFFSYLESFKPEIHIKANLLSNHINTLPINIESIPYSDNSFDIVIANHTLEHTKHVKTALHEIQRVLKPNGFAILQTPFCNITDLPLELQGQEKHVRLLGKDIFNLLPNYFDIDIKSHADIFNKNIATLYGVNSKHSLFLCYKKSSKGSIKKALNLPTEKEIMSQWIFNSPLTSIHCITYNHEKFIRKTLDSLLQQNTSFPFEIVIGEDCSTDQTKRIINSYKDLYPNIIKIISSETNVGVYLNYKRTYEACNGKYIAICEGDDYWTDVNKLQKQVDYLEAHPECVITYGAVQGFHKDTIIHEYIGGTTEDTTPEELKRTKAINSLTTCYRNVIPSLPDEFLLTSYADLFIWSLLGHHGSGHFLSSLLPSRYRIHEDGIHSSKSMTQQQFMLIETVYALHLFYQSKETNLNDYFKEQIRLLLRSIQASIDINIKELIIESAMKLEKRDLSKKIFNKSHYIDLLTQLSPNENNTCTAENKKTIAYLNHPFDIAEQIYTDTQILSGISHLNDYTISSAWKNEGDLYSLDYNVITQCDIILVHNKGVLFNETIFKLKAHGKKIVYLMDNNPFIVPVKDTSYAYYESLKPRIKTTLEHSDLVLVSSEILKKQLEKVCSSNVLEIGVNTKFWTEKVNKQENEKIVIAFFGDEHDIESLNFITPILEYIKTTYKERVHIKIFGRNVSSYKLFPFSDYETMNLTSPSYSSWIKFLREQNIDIALLPSNGNPYVSSKTTLKAFEYSLSNIAIIASNELPYNEFIEDEINGFLCDATFKKWKNAIDKLVNNAKLRTQLSNNAFKKVLDYHTDKHNEISWKKHLDLLQIKNKRENITTDVFKQIETSWRKYQIISKERYPAWLGKRRFKQKDIPFWAKEAEYWNYLPHFTMFLHVDEPNLETLNNTLASISNQLYPKWTLVLHSIHASPDPIFQENQQLEWFQSNNEFLDDINHIVKENPLEWVITLNCGDIFEPTFLSTFVQCLQKDGSPRLIYCDNGYINNSNVLVDPQFKPDFNIDMLRSYDYISGTFIIHKNILEKINYYNQTLAGAVLYDMIFRCYEHHINIQHIDELIWHKHQSTKDEDVLLFEKASTKIALINHLQRSNIEAEVIDSSHPETLRVLYHYNNEPKVSIIIPTRNKYNLLFTCVESIKEKTIYSNYEIIIINNQSDESDILEYFRLLKNEHSNISIIEYDDVFNYSTANNLGVEHASGEILLFLNNDTEVIHENWLNILVSYALRKDIGIVGPRLLFNDGSIQHAGVTLGHYGPANHIYASQLPSTEGYMKRLQVDQNMSAVTGACMMMRKEVFTHINGFNDHDYTIYYSDIDICLKAIDLGYKNIWTPYVTLFHHESKSVTTGNKEELESRQKIFSSDQYTLIEKWLKYIERDPSFSRYLDFGGQQSLINIEDLPSWNFTCNHTPKVWSIPRNFDGGGLYRVINPMEALSNAGLVQTHISWQYLNRAFLITKFQPDVLLLQTPLNDYQLEFIKIMKKDFSGKILFEIDDLLTNIPKDNIAYAQQSKDMEQRIENALSMCDRLIVSTEPLKNAYGKYAKECHVVPNYLHKDPWTKLISKRNQSNKLRVGWAGSPFHTGDLKIISKVVKKLGQRVEWVFMGMYPEGCKKYIHEYHKPVPLEDYPEKLASLNLDLALVPLEINPFNEAKSNLRLLEMGILGWPIICSDVYPYRNAPVTRVQNNAEEWLSAIEDKILDTNSLKNEGDVLRQWVLDNYILEENVEKILPSYI